MSIWRKVFTTQIEGSPEVIFELIADMPNYGRWLSGSKAFGAFTTQPAYVAAARSRRADRAPS
jgi:hypothetical protein